MKNKYIKKFLENIKILFLIFFTFSLGMYFYYEKINENEIEKITFLNISSTIFIGFFLVKIILPKIFDFFKKIYNSKRYDIGAFIIFGIIFFVYNFILGKIVFSEYFEKIKNIYFELNKGFYYINWILLTFILLVLIICFIKLYNKKENEKKGILCSDKSIESKEKDELGMNSRAKDFAKTVWNNGNNDSFVFGLIAPWGHGKTSFLNLFDKELKTKDKYKNKYEIFKFNPWYFESEKSLLEKFLTGISSQLSSKYFLPKLDGDLKKLINFLQDKGNGIFNTNFNFSKTESLEEIKDNINNSLKDLDKKLIIIIDDLDRFTSEKLKVIFKILDLCKNFHNTTYILCYDPNNFNNIDSELKETRIQNIGENNNVSSISTENIDNKNLVKYIAKIINIQYPIYPDYEKLKEYFKNLFISEIKLDFSPKSQEGIRNGIDELYSLENFRIWGEYISDIRSMKRIANNLIAINSVISKKEDFIYNLFDEESGGLVFSNFLKLSILSLNFNHLYLDIYSEVKLEGNGKYKYYLTSEKLAKYKFIVGGDNKQLSGAYNTYINILNNTEKLLLNDIFKITQNTYQEDYIKTHISYMGNLNGYIDIIEVNKNAKFNRFIKNKIEEYNTSPIDGIIKEIERKYGEDGIQKFINEFKINFGGNEYKIEALINYILNNFYKYSINGINNYLPKYIIELLDIITLGKNTNNQIILDIFKRVKLIEKLSNEEWGLIGYFLLFHIIDLIKNGNYFNIKSVINIDEINEKINKIFFEKIEKKNFIEKIFKTKKNVFLIKEDIKIFKGYKKIEVITKVLNILISMYKGDISILILDNFGKDDKTLKYFLQYLSIFTNYDMYKEVYFYDVKRLFFNLPKSNFIKFLKKHENSLENIVMKNKDKILIKKDDLGEISKNFTYQEFWEIFKKEFELQTTPGMSSEN